MQTAWIIAKTGVHFTASLTARDIFKPNNGPKQPVCPELGKTEITEWLQFVSTRPLGSRDARGAWELLLYDEVFRSLHQIRGGLRRTKR